MNNRWIVRCSPAKRRKSTLFIRARLLPAFRQPPQTRGLVDVRRDRLLPIALLRSHQASHQRESLRLSRLEKLRLIDVIENKQATMRLVCKEGMGLCGGKSMMHVTGNRDGYHQA